jgi:hypothetical protein
MEVKIEEASILSNRTAQSVSQLIIDSALGGFYPEGGILTSEVKPLSNNQVQVKFQFPPPQQPLFGGMHVSSATMFQAMLEGCYACCINSIMQNAYPDSGSSVEVIRELRQQEKIFLVESRQQFRQLINKGDAAELTFSLKEPFLFNGQLRCSYEFKGFMRGYSVCIQPLIGEMRAQRSES